MRKVFTKLLLSFVFVLLAGTAIFDLSLRPILERTIREQPHGALDLLLASFLALAAATLLAAFLTGRISQRLDRIVLFANRIAAGDLSARLQEENLDELSDVARALDMTASRLEQSFRELEASRRELTALLDSMQEAVVAVNAQGQIIWSNAVMQRICASAVREGRRLVELVRDPDVLSCVEGALRQRVNFTGKALSVAPGRIFEV